MSKEDRGWSILRHFIAGSASGVALVVAGHGFDTIKVRMQTDTSGRFNGVIDCLIKCLREEGGRGLYKGASPPMVATGFINSVMFGLMGLFGNALRKSPETPLSIPQIMLCGTVSGAMLSLIVTPIEGIKARLQVQYKQPPGTPAQYSGPIDCARQLIRNHGFRGLYIGWLPTVLHRGSNWSYFGAYEAVKRYLTPPGNEGKLSPLASITAGACAGTAFWLSCYPIDVIKNRIQTEPDIPGKKKLYDRGILQCAKTIYKREGAAAFFKGLTPCLIRSVPANSAAFFAFEVFRAMKCYNYNIFSCHSGSFREQEVTQPPSISMVVHPIFTPRACHWFNRWFTFVASFLALFCGGTAYLFASYSEDVKEKLHLEQSSVNLLGTSFYFAQVGALPVAAAFDRFGPRPVLWSASIFLAGGYTLFRHGLINEWPIGVLSIGLVMVGLGSVGIYLSSIGPNIVNFGIHNKGKVVGALVTMFGGSSAILAQIYEHVFKRRYSDPSRALLDFMMTLSIGLGATVAIAAFFINIIPPKEEKVEEKTINTDKEVVPDEETALLGESKPVVIVDPLLAYPQRTWFQAIRSFDFHLLFFSYLIGVGAGSTLSTTLAQLSRSLGNRDTTTLLVLFVISNAVIRPIMGSTSDVLSHKLSRPGFMMISLFFLSLTQLWSCFVTKETLYPIVVFTGIGFGSVFMLAPVTVNEIFGSKHWGKNNATVNVGPAIGNYLFVLMQAHIYKSNSSPDSIQCYGIECFRLTFIIMSILCGFGFLSSVILWERTRELYRLKWLASKK
ncbi:mitochondrial substrate carrier family protein [Planoprotostelium fungivorum]|uniref:Mitochondrial substrate carrier family protein n=1 Tax=Planoprotostelium fungivorum TaxID=1890364 RepID=A0A2P6N991_9EUKA|nr:mitochondrial substrate carrier family protein [Planoprotostelium fungivorum]